MMVFLKINRTLLFAGGRFNKSLIVAAILHSRSLNLYPVLLLFAVWELISRDLKIEPSHLTLLDREEVKASKALLSEISARKSLTIEK